MSYVDKVSVDGLVYDVQDTNTKAKVNDIERDLNALEVVVDGVGAKVGSGNLSTDSQTIIGGVNENKSDIDSINSAIGSEELATTSKTLKGAINEVNSAISEIGQGGSGGSYIHRNITFPNLTVNLASGGSMDIDMVTDVAYIDWTRWCGYLVPKLLHIPDGCVFVQTELIPSNGDGRSQIKGKLYNISDSDISGGVFSPRMLGLCSQ